MAEVQPERMGDLLVHLKSARDQGRYLHWDKLRRQPEPEGLTHREWWYVLKLSRMEGLRDIGLLDVNGKSFQFSLPQEMMEDLHHIDMGAGGRANLPEPITNPQTRDRYLVTSLMEEAITSSQLEGAVTTREVAKEMIRTGRKARDTSEQMILNNYATMQRVQELKSEALTPEIILQLHRLVTDQTLENDTSAGRFRRADESVRVADDYGNIFHNPPPAEELSERLALMCDFANGRSPDYFVHPAARAIILHFWLAYDHPFVDGNGRTARALFYWAMLHHGYWLFEFISISSILRKAPAKYARSFLYTETDDNDLTYFLIAQSTVIRNAVKELHAYIDRKTAELRDVESHVRALDLFNHRQVGIIRHALKYPGQRYTFVSHQTSNKIVYQTARSDLLELAERGVLEKRKRGRQLVFIAPIDLGARLLKLEREADL